MRKPPRLQEGDRIAALTLSWGGPAEFPEQYEHGKRQLEDAFGFEVVELPMTLAAPEVVADHPERRAADLHTALTDPSIAGIVSTIGGDDSIRILRHLDLELIAEHPKVMVGFSDTTVTLAAFLRAGVVGFYGPAVMAGFGEAGGLHGYTVEGFRRAVVEPEAGSVWSPNEDGWTCAPGNWEDPAARDRPRPLTPSDGWRWHGGETTTGRLVPACFEVLDWLRGTPWHPDLDGAVLALETSEELPTPEVIVRYLRTLAASGDLARLSGLLLGRPANPADETGYEHEAYDRAILDVVRGEEGLDDLPIVTGLDFGHTFPQWTLPVGLPIHVDVERRRCSFPEPGVL